MIRGGATLAVVLATFGVFHIKVIQYTLVGMQDFRAQFAMKLIAVFPIELVGVVFVSVRSVLWFRHVRDAATYKFWFWTDVNGNLMCLKYFRGFKHFIALFTSQILGIFKVFIAFLTLTGFAASGQTGNLTVINQSVSEKLCIEITENQPVLLAIIPIFPKIFFLF